MAHSDFASQQELYFYSTDMIMSFLCLKASNDSLLPVGNVPSP